MRKYLFAAALVSTVIGGGAIAAQTTTAPVTPRPMQADADGDGAITRAEYLAQAGDRFDRMDANHDGRIDRTERANMREQRREMRGGQSGRQPAPGETPPPVPSGQ